MRVLHMWTRLNFPQVTKKVAPMFSYHIPHMWGRKVNGSNGAVRIQTLKMESDYYILFFASVVYSFFLFLIFFLFGSFKKKFIVIQLQLSAFSPHPSTPPQANPLPSSTSTLCLDFIHVSFIVVTENPSPTIPSPHPSDYCQIVLNFSVSGYILFAFFLLLIMFQLKVRSYGICPSPPGLFHLA